MLKHRPRAGNGARLVITPQTERVFLAATNALASLSVAAVAGQPGCPTLHPAPDTQHPTPNTQHPTPNTQHPTPNTQHPTPSISRNLRARLTRIP